MVRFSASQRGASPIAAVAISEPEKTRFDKLPARLLAKLKAPLWKLFSTIVVKLEKVFPLGREHETGECESPRRAVREFALPFRPDRSVARWNLSAVAHFVPRVALGLTPLPTPASCRLIR